MRLTSFRMAADHQMASGYRLQIFYLSAFRISSANGRADAGFCPVYRFPATTTWGYDSIGLVSVYTAQTINVTYPPCLLRLLILPSERLELVF